MNPTIRKYLPLVAWIISLSSFTYMLFNEDYLESSADTPSMLFHSNIYASERDLNYNTPDINNKEDAMSDALVRIENNEYVDSSVTTSRDRNDSQNSSQDIPPNNSSTNQSQSMSPQDNQPNRNTSTNPTPTPNTDDNVPPESEDSSFTEDTQFVEDSQIVEENQYADELLYMEEQPRFPEPLPDMTPLPAPEPAIISVPVARLSMSVGRSTPTFKTGETGSVTTIVFPSIATDKNYNLTSSNTSVINISQDGRFLCNAAGESIITATATNGVKRELYITVVDTSDLANEVIALSNSARSRNGIAALLNDNAHLNAAAKTRATEITTNFSHTRPNGNSHSTSYEEQGGKYTGIYHSVIGENITAGYSTATNVVAAWMNSETHRSNILNPYFTHIGVAVDIDSNGRLYWTQLFYG